MTSRTQQMLDDITILLSEPHDSPRVLEVKRRQREEAIERDLYRNPQAYLAGMLDVSAMPRAKEQQLASWQNMDKIQLSLSWFDIAPDPESPPAKLFSEFAEPSPDLCYRAPDAPGPEYRRTRFGWTRDMRIDYTVGIPAFLEEPEEVARLVGEQLAHAATGSHDWIKFRDRSAVFDERFDEGGYPKQKPPPTR